MFNLSINYPHPGLPPKGKGAKRNELARWASLATAPDYRGGFSPLGEIRKGVRKLIVFLSLAINF